MPKGPAGALDRVKGIRAALPKPIQSLADLMLPMDDPMGNLSPTPLTVLPLAKLQHSLSDLGADLISKAKSPILRMMYRPMDVGSSDIARVASGLRPSGYGKGGLGLAVPFEHKDANIDEFLRQHLYGNRVPARSEARLASEELYNISQRVLEDVGLKPGESLDVFRSGTVPKQPHALTPTHVERDVVDGWGGRPTEQFRIPKERVRALPGLLHRGDNVTQGEALVPSLTLQQNRIAGRPNLSFWDDYDPNAPLVLRDPGSILPTAATRTPSWYKKQVLK